MILPVFYNSAGGILCLVAVLFGMAVTSLFVRESSGYWVGVFLVASGLFSAAGSLYLSKRKKIGNHVWFIPVWGWGILASLIGAYGLYEYHTFRLSRSFG